MNRPQDIQPGTGEAEPKLRHIWWQLAKIAVPAFFCQFFSLLQESINLWFIGKLDDPVLINAIGLGNVIMSLFGQSVVFGLNSALGTFVSQAYGAREFEKCGVFRHRARFVILIVITALVPVYLNVESILCFFEMDPIASKHAGLYISTSIPSLILLGLLDIDRAFLASFENSKISMWCEMASPFVHVLVAYLYVIVLDLGVIGCSLALASTNLIGYAIQNYFMKRQLLVAAPAFAVKWNDSRNFQEIPTYLSISVPSMLLIIFEFSSMDLQAILTGYISTYDMASFVILINFNDTIYALPNSINTAACTFIGKYIGSGNVPVAQKYMRGVVSFSLLICAVESTLMIVFREQIINSFTTNQEIRAIGHRVVWIYLLTNAIDFWQCAMTGIIRAFGKQRSLSIISFLSNYVIMIPLSFLFTFRTGCHSEFYEIISLRGAAANTKPGLGQVGTWLAIAIGFVNMLIWQTAMIRCANWHQIVREAMKRID